MSQKIVNGFPQFYALTHLVSEFYGTALTQLNQNHTDVDLQAPHYGDQISADVLDVGLLTVTRDGATLYLDQGFEIVAPNILRVFPGLLDGETLQFKKLVGASGVVETIQTVPPVPGSGGYAQEILEATIYTDDSVAAINAFSPVILAGKTRISTHFALNEGKIDVFLNGSRVSVNDGIWFFADSTTIELDDNYSTTKMKVDITRQKVG